MKSTPKPKRCKHCKQEFTPSRPLQIACGPVCALAMTIVKSERNKAAAMKADRAETKARREKIKTRRQWATEAQAAINAYVRKRDEALPCISCGRYHQGQWHAGHYLSRGAHPELAYEPKNLAKQCQPCNSHLSGNQINFRKGLIERIGLEKVEWLEGPHEPKHYSIDDLKAIKAFYRAKIKTLI